MKLSTTSSRISKVILLSSVLVLNGCTIWDILKPTSSGLSVETEIVVGDKKEEIDTEVVGKKETTNNSAESINQTYNTINKEYPFWVVALLVLGWMLPSPRQLGITIMNLFRRKKNA